jgi:hypothetical protein
MRRSMDRATITVRRGDVPADRRRFTGRVLVDSRMSLDLIADAPARFEVEPGEHTIAIFFTRRPEIFWSGRRRVATTSVSLRAREQAEFVCGIRPDVVRKWRRLRRLWAIRGLLLTAPFALAWLVNDRLIGPYWREMIATLVWYLPERSMLIPLCYRIPNPLVLVVCFLLVKHCLLEDLSGLTDSGDEMLLSYFGSPYYIERAAQVPGADP